MQILNWLHRKLFPGKALLIAHQSAHIHLLNGVIGTQLQVVDNFQAAVRANHALVEPLYAIAWPHMNPEERRYFKGQLGEPVPGVATWVEEDTRV